LLTFDFEEFLLISEISLRISEISIAIFKNTIIAAGTTRAIGIYIIKVISREPPDSYVIKKEAIIPPTSKIYAEIFKIPTQILSLFILKKPPLSLEFLMVKL